MGLKKYRHGYIGFVETDHRYFYFHFSRDSYKVLQSYSKEEYENSDHFISVMRKFVHATFFFRRPKPIKAITADVLERILTAKQAASSNT